VDELTSLSDDALLERTPEDAEAFGVFYERHVRAVIAFLKARGLDTEASLDLAAEVFAAALVASRRYRPGEAPARAWLLGIARNKLAAARRHEAVELSARRKLGVPRLTFSDEALSRVEELVDLAAEPYLNGLAHLPKAEREAVAARVIAERDYVEIAERENATPEAIRQRVSRGLAKLARLGRGGP
jgi:RNA polymerase sigma factor (sigma-70 family)